MKTIHFRPTHETTSPSKIYTIKNASTSLFLKLCLGFVSATGAIGCGGDDNSVADSLDAAGLDSKAPKNDSAVTDSQTHLPQDDADTPDSIGGEDVTPSDAMDGGPKPDGALPDGDLKPDGALPDGDPEPPPDNTGNLNDLPLECQKPIVEGDNTDWTAGTWKRKFHASFPKNTSTAPAVVFLFHGYGDNADNFRKALPLNPDADPSFPFIVITPTATGLGPFSKPQGLDWDLANGEYQSTNREVLLVKSVLACLKKQNNADPARVYSVGFSAGSVFSSLLHTTFQNDIAAIVALSGMWFNDPEQVKTIKLPIPLSAKWDTLDPKYGGNVLVAHGGLDDKINILGVDVVSLNETGKASMPFLTKAKRTVVYCTHTEKHTLPPALTPSRTIAYLKAHKKGESSPYLTSGLDAELAKANCTLEKAE